MALAASGLSPTARTYKPQRVDLKNQYIKGARAIPMRKRGQILKADCTAEISIQLAKEIPGNWGAAGLIKGLPKKKAIPLPKIIMAIPTATSLTLGC